MRKKILSMVLALCMVLTMMPVPTMAVEDVEYNIWVGGVPVTSDNMNNIAGPGITGTAITKTAITAIVSYEPTTNTLTFNNANITTAYEDSFWHDKYCIYSQVSEPLTLKLIGDNFITGVDSIRSTYGIYCDGELNIEGEGTLTVTPGEAYYTGAETGNNHSSGIFTGDGLIINNIIIDIRGEQYGLLMWGDNITINGGTVTAYGSNYAIGGNLKANGQKVSVMVGDVEPGEEWDGEASLINNYEYVKIELDPYFITDIAMTNAASVQVNNDLILEGTVSSNTDTSHTIIWRVEDANDTGATINDGTFRATSEGTATVKASVTNGLTAGDNYSENFSITVTAAPVITHTITATTTTGGSISPSGSVTVNNGDNQTFTITPNSNYSIDDVKVDDRSQGAINTYTFNSVTEDHTISATFRYRGSSGFNSGKKTPSKNSSSTDDVALKEEAPAFTDIANHWAKEDIQFMVSRGLLGGTSDTTFSPDTAMTRGMFVTVLGRLANANVEIYNESIFNDVKSDADYMKYIEWASKNNIVKGIGNGNFAPDQDITREQMAVIMRNYAKTMDFKLTQAHGENDFADSAKISDYAKEAVRQMQKSGVISGKSRNIFDPQGLTTRAEVSAVLHRFVELVSSKDTM